MRVVLDEAAEMADGVYGVQLRPIDAQRLGGNPVTQGVRSVVLAEDAHFDQKSATLSAELTDLRALAVGTSDRAIVILNGDQPEMAISQSPYSERDAKFDAKHFPGDREFLEEATALPEQSEVAIRRLLGLIRRRDPGSMKRGGRRNFSNQPDNFWYAIIQPLKGNVSITVRGKPEMFQPSTLELKDDRPGYTRFYLSDPSEVDEAFRIVSASRRRK